MRPSHTAHEPVAGGGGLRPATQASGSPMRPEALLCPEILLRLRPQVWASWRTGSGSDIPAHPPYWALAWPSGQALARWILDHPEIVAHRNVADWGAGCGVVAVAAALAGARRVLAIDRDRLAIEAIEENARINGVSQRVVAFRADLRSAFPSEAETILAADLWYDYFESAAITAALRSTALRGSTVLIGGSARAYEPRAGLTILSRRLVLSDPEIEPTSCTQTYVARLENATARARG